MKTFFYFILLSLLTALVASESMPSRLIIAYEDKTQFPYYIGDDGITPQDQPGAAVELVKMLEQAIPGLEIELQRYPWKRCLAMLEAGRVDAIFNASFTDERTLFARYPMRPDGSVDNERRLTSISYSWYENSKNPVSLSNNPLVVAPLGYSIVAQLESMDYRVVQAPTSLSALRMLRSRYIDVAALQTVTGDYLLLNHSVELAELRRIEPTIDDKAYFLLFSKTFYQQYPEFTERLWDTLALLRDTELPAIVQRYLSSDSE